MGTRERQILPVRPAAGGGRGATPRGLLNRPGRERRRAAESRRGTRSGRKRRADARSELRRPAESGGGGTGRLGGTGKEERNRPLQVPSARPAASAPPGGKAAFPCPIVTSLSIRSRFLPRAEAADRGIGTGITGICPLVPHRRNLNFQQRWKVHLRAFACHLRR